MKFIDLLQGLFLHLKRGLGNMFFVSRCAICSEGVASSLPQALCAKCWSGLEFITDPACQYCGQCIDYCTCSKRKRNIELFISALRYNSYAMRLISRFKYKDARKLAPLLASILVQRLASTAYSGVFNKEADLWLPVPLHRDRLRERGYNQSALLLNYISKISKTNIICRNDILFRTKNNKRQAELSKKQRMDNVEGIFEINARNAHLILNRKIVIVDDVMTTGATIQECAKVIMSHGAKSVIAISIAKT